MTARQLRIWLIEQIKLAEPLDSKSDMSDPQAVAVKASKRLALVGYGSGELLTRAGLVATPFQCAAVLADCIKALPHDEASDNLTPKDIAKQLRVSRETVLGWINSRQLLASNIASGSRPRWIIAKSDFDAFLRSRQSEPAAPKKRAAKPANGFKRY